MADQCFGRWALTLLYEDKQANATFFDLGSAIHETIENAIQFDWDLDRAIKNVKARVRSYQAEARTNGRRTIETSKRGMDTMPADAERMITNWFKFVHPDSNKRHPIYDDYEWPPQVEVTFEGEGYIYPVWGSIDAVFQRPSVNANHIMIVDWKSGTQKQKTDFQLNFYRFGLGVRNVPAVFHHLERVQKRSMIQEAAPYPGDEEMLWQIAHTEDLKLALLDIELPEFNPDWYCNYCPVQDFCPADGDQRDRAANLTALKQMLPLLRPMEYVLRKESNGV